MSPDTCEDLQTHLKTLSGDSSEVMSVYLSEDVSENISKDPSKDMTGNASEDISLGMFAFFTLSG